MCTEKVFQKYIITALVGIAISIFLLEIWSPAEQMDDAYISYRYAQNLADGNGLVFNKGEYVEGYTNLSWTLLVALGIKLGLDAPVAGHILMMLSGVFLLLTSLMLSQALLPKKYSYAAALSPLILLATNSFACWTASGLETPLFAGLTTLAFYYFIKERFIAVACICVLAAFTRPEGVLLGGFLLGMQWLKTVWDTRPTSLRSVFIISLPCLIFGSYIILHTAFRVFYYEDVVPNTFHAKVGGIPVSRGLSYLYKFFIDGPGLLIIPALFAVWRRRIPMVLTAYFLLTISYICYVGGDVFRLGRFMLPILPLLISAALVGYQESTRYSKKISVLILIIIALSSWVSLYAPWLKGTDFEDIHMESFPVSSKRINARNHSYFVSDDWLKNRCKEIQALYPPIETIAAVGIGKPGYYMMNIRIIDLVGLTDKTIAKSTKIVDAPLIAPGHQRTDAGYVLEQTPDVIWIQKKGEANVFTLPAIVDLWNQVELERDYYWDHTFTFYRRNL